MENFIKDLERVEQEYNREFLERKLNIVTTEREITGDTCNGQNRGTIAGDECDGRGRETRPVTVVKYYTVKPKEYFTDRHYENYKGTTYQKYIKDIPPRKFYSEDELRTYMAVLNKWAGRTIEDDEMRLLLRYITSGRHYQLVCLVDVTKQLKSELVWKDIK